MKKLLPLIFATLLLAGCASQGSTKMTDDQIFQKKQECASHKEKIEQEIQDENIKQGFQESFYELDQLFYSPLKNTCIYSYRWIGLQNNFTVRNVLDYFIVDYFTKDMLFKTDIGYVNSGSLEQYNVKLKELKAE